MAKAINLKQPKRPCLRLGMSKRGLRPDALNQLHSAEAPPRPLYYNLPLLDNLTLCLVSSIYKIRYLAKGVGYGGPGSLSDSCFIRSQNIGHDMV